VSAVTVLALGVVGVPAAMACGGGHGGSVGHQGSGNHAGYNSHDGSGPQGSHTWGHHDGGSTNASQGATGSRHAGGCGGSTGSTGSTGDGGPPPVTPPVTPGL